MEDNLHKGAESKLFYFARQNRQSPTEAEEILWKYLRNRNLNGLKFRRQHPIANFIADFYCAERNLAVELDGEYHYSRDQKEYDEGRTYELTELNVCVVRFTNREVMENLDFVLREISNRLLARAKH